MRLVASVCVCMYVYMYVYMYVCMYVCMYMWTKKLAVLGFNALKSPGSVIYCFFVEFNHQKGGLLRQEVTSEKDNRKHSINGTRERFSENCITAVVHVLLAIPEICVPSYTVVSILFRLKLN